MAVIGHAEIVVTAITKNFEKQLKQSMGNINRNMSSRAGRAIGDGFADGFDRSRATNMFGKLSDGLRSMVPEAESARQRFQSLVRTGYTLQAALGAVVGGISSVVVSIGPLIGSLMKAAAAGAAFLNILTTLQVAIRVGKAAFGDIGSAVSQAIKPTNGLGKSMAQLRREFKKLQFDAEDAALSVSRAELELSKAIQEAARVQDLAPNSLIRREAELAVEEAELALRRAKRESKDLNKDVDKGPQALQTGGGGDPFANLNKFQREFAEYIVSLNPKFKKLQENLSKAFLPPLQRAVEILMKEIFPILNKRLPAVAKATGDAMKGIAIQIAGPQNAKKIDDILVNMLPNITLIGEIFGNILDSILSIVAATDKLATEFLTAVRDKTKEWVDSLNAGLEDGSLKKFFEDAAEEAKKWFKVVGNIFGGFKNLMKLTTGPGSAGEEMLNWFTEASEEFKNMFAEDPDAGKKFFKDAMINARSVLGAIGAFIKEILGVADNPNIKVTFDTLAKAAPSFGDMLDKMIDAAPSFAELIVTIVEIANLLTDSDQISAFFDTLNDGAKGFKKILESPFIKTALDNLGPLFATFSALGVIFNVLQFGFQVFIGYVAFGLAKVNGLFDIFKGKGDKAGGGFKNLGKAIKGAGIIGLIILVVTKIVEFYEKFEDFRTMVDETVANVGESFSGVFEELDRLFENLFGGEDGGGLLAVLDPILKFLLEALIPGIGLVLSTLANAIETALSLVNNFLEAFMPGFKALFEAIGYLLEGNFPMFAQKIMEAVRLIVAGVAQNTLNGLIDLLNGGIRFINDWVKAVASGPLGQFFKEKFGIDLATAQIKEITKVRWVQDLERQFKNDELKRQFSSSGSDAAERRRLTRNMALGGTVYPSDGGTIVRVAEAGRPERIEPLDSNGLSERDKALISELSGGGGATINVYPSAGMDEKEIANIVSRNLAFQVRKGTF